MPFDPSQLQRAADDPLFGEPPPLGDYVAKFTHCSTFKSKAGTDFLKLTFQVAEGRLRNHEWESVHPLEGTQGLAITANQLRALGVDIGKVTSEHELINLLVGLEGHLYDVRVMESEDGKWTNTVVRSEHRRVRDPLFADEPDDHDLKAARDQAAFEEFKRRDAPATEFAST